MNTQKSDVQIIGNVAMYPEVKTTLSGRKVARFTLSDFSFRTENELDENPGWFSLVAWEEQADIVEQYLYKGRRVGISGQLVSRVWFDNQGRRHSMAEIIISDIVIMDDLRAVA
jgi:single-strand DNA-binding protein